MDPYKTESIARVTSVEGAEIQLDRTIFFAFSGGQESDSGTIGGVKVLKAEKHDKDIVYTMEPQKSKKNKAPFS